MQSFDLDDDEDHHTNQWPDQSKARAAKGQAFHRRVAVANLDQAMTQLLSNFTMIGLIALGYMMGGTMEWPGNSWMAQAAVVIGVLLHLVASVRRYLIASRAYNELHPVPVLPRRH